MFNLADKYCFYLDKDNDKNMEIFLLLRTLEQYINGAIIEMNRLEKTRKNIAKKLSIRFLSFKTGVASKSIGRKDFQLTYLACDTHFFFICIDKCYKLIAQLSFELDDLDIKKLKVRLNTIFDIDTVRNHLEHIEDRCVGYGSKKDKNKKIKRQIQDFGNFPGDDFSFNNKKFPTNKKSLEELKHIYLDLIKIIHSKYASNDKYFVERMKSEERTKLILKALKKDGLIK
jgi:hypothetical protein